jgi:hypothetical protein
MKKRGLLVPIVAAVIAFAVMGGVALAQGDNESAGSPWSSFASRVASILGLDEATVQDAFDQATSDMQDEALQGQITQEQADEYYTWYQSRPEGMPFGGFGGRGFGRGGMWGGMKWGGPCGHGSGGLTPEGSTTPSSSQT